MVHITVIGMDVVGVPTVTTVITATAVTFIFSSQDPFLCQAPSLYMKTGVYWACKTFPCKSIYKIIDFDNFLLVRNELNTLSENVWKQESIAAAQHYVDAILQ